MRAVALLALVGCAAGPDLAVDEQALATCAVSAETQVEETFDRDDTLRLFADDDDSDTGVRPPIKFGPDPGPCSQVTVVGRMKLELCWTASATQDEITQCLWEAAGGSPTYERQQFCLALLANHDVVACSDFDVSTTYEYRDEQCKLQTRKGRTKAKGCTRVSDGEAVGHPARCVTILDGSTKGDKVGDVNDCPRCAQCSTAPDTL